jgi:hypothetical protein
MTPNERRIMDELAELVGRHFIRNGVPANSGVRMVGTLLTFLALESGLSASEFGRLMTDMHQSMQDGRKQG